MTNNILCREDIVDLSCGEEHVVAVCGDGQVFVWGSGKDGRLGTGGTEPVIAPAKVSTLLVFVPRLSPPSQEGRLMKVFRSKSRRNS